MKDFGNPVSFAGKPDFLFLYRIAIINLMFEFSLFSVAFLGFLSKPTWDIVLILALIAGGFFYGISSGKARIAATILYTYVAWAIFSAVSFDKFLADFSLPQKFFVQVFIFLIFFFLLAFFLGSRRKPGKTPASSWWQVFILSFLQVGFLIHIILTILPDEVISELAPLTRTVFANPELHIWWILAPIGSVIILKKIESE